MSFEILSENRKKKICGFQTDRIEPRELIIQMIKKKKKLSCWIGDGEVFQRLPTVRNPCYPTAGGAQGGDCAPR